MALVRALVEAHAVAERRSALTRRQLENGGGGGSGGGGFLVNHVSPRHFLELIARCAALHAEKRAALTEEHTHLRRGLRAIEQTRRRVSELQIELAEADKELARKNDEANERLKLIVSRQHEAEEERGKAERLAATLAEARREIASQQEAAGAELAAVEPELAARAAVRSIKKENLNEVRALACPPELIKLALEAVAAAATRGVLPTTGRIRGASSAATTLFGRSSSLTRRR